MFDKAKQLYQLQKQARQLKKELANIHIEAEVDGIIVTVNGEQEVISIFIPEEMKITKHLADTLVKACNKAIKKAQEIAAEKMKPLMGNMNMPNLEEEKNK